MEPIAPERMRFLDSLRSLGRGLLTSASDRIALLAVELQEEKIRLILTFIWIGAALFAGAMAIVFASLTLVYLYWDSARLTVLGGLTVAYAGAWVALILTFRRFWAQQPKPFAATLHELAADRACFHPKS